VESEGQEYSSDYTSKLLERGDQVVLFLTQVEGMPGVFDLPWGEDSLIWITQTSDFVDIPVRLRKLPELREQPRLRTDDFLAAIRLNRAR
jgi:hypothetical protein